MPKKDAGKGKEKATKVAVDKTFGMKNKKGAQVQKQIAQIKHAVSQAKTPEEKRKEAEKIQREKDKLAEEKARKEDAELFKPIQSQKVPFGVDPKTVVCQYWKKGFCEKGKRCKFAHDLAVERKAEKRDLYADAREKEEEDEKKDDMANWDEAKLREVVLSKHGNPKTTTDKVCKFFIEAVENQKYGWFWTCPNGGDQCKYRHSLPPGFVLKTKEQRAAEKALFDKSPLNTLTIEDFLESERHKLSGTLTPVTPESFAKWKKGRMDKKEAEQALQKAKDDTGRAMFEKGGWDVSDDEDADEADDIGWNLQQLRLETEKARQRKEEERLTGGYTNGNGVTGNDEDDVDDDDDTTNGLDPGEGSSVQPLTA